MSSVEEVTIPKAALDELMRQISTLQSTVDKLTALLEEKNQIILNQNRVRFVECGAALPDVDSRPAASLDLIESCHNFVV